MQPEPNATNNYFNQLQMYQKFCKSDGKILTQSALSWYIWYEHFNTSNAVISLTEKVSELTSKSANKQEGRSGGFLFVFRYQQCSCFDSKHKMFTQEKESKVQTRPERLRQLKVSWKETKEQNRTVTEAVSENQLAAWIFSSQWWFQGFVWKPFNIAHNPWDWKDDGQH